MAAQIGSLPGTWTGSGLSPTFRLRSTPSAAQWLGSQGAGRRAARMARASVQSVLERARAGHRARGRGVDSALGTEIASPLIFLGGQISALLIAADPARRVIRKCPESGQLGLPVRSLGLPRHSRNAAGVPE